MHPFDANKRTDTYTRTADAAAAISSQTTTAAKQENKQEPIQVAVAHTIACLIMLKNKKAFTTKEAEKLLEKLKELSQNKEASQLIAIAYTAGSLAAKKPKTTQVYNQILNRCIKENPQ